MMEPNFKKILNVLMIVAFLNTCESKDKPLDKPVDVNLLCAETICPDIECPDVPEHCEAQNATHSGTWMTSPTMCNCCQYCLVNLMEDDPCTQGSLGSPPTGTVCGPGLTCKATGQKSRCTRMVSKCHNAQKDYDDRRELGTLGFLETRPNCDGRADFEPVHCVTGQSCFCLAKTGVRIFGESLNDEKTSLNMKCGCSRAADIVSTLVGGQATGRRCLSDGSYDPIQCLNNRCFCVNVVTGDISSAKVIDGSSQPLTSLPCFDSSIHHSTTSYMRECEEYRLEVLESLKESKEAGFTLLGNPVPSCQPDGNFDSMQYQKTKRICVDATGKQIQNFGTETSSPASKTMNCKCARTWDLLKSANAVSLPTCCSNGNWRSIQCRGNFCYCVDQDGRQQGLEVKSDQVIKLKCYTGNTWQKC